MKNLINEKIRYYIRLISYGVDDRDLFSNLQGYLNALLDTNKITYNQYNRYRKYINHKFI